MNEERLIFQITEFREIDPFHMAIYNPEKDLTVIFHNPFVGHQLREILDKKRIGYEAGVKSIHLKGKWKD